MDYIEELNRSIKWAKDFIKESENIILDTETTGLSKLDQIIEIAIISVNGKALIDQRIKPTVPIDPGAIKIHKIYDKDLVDCPSWIDIDQKVMEILSKAKRIAIFNKSFDLRLINQTRNAFGLGNLPRSITSNMDCAMLEYSTFIGEPNHYKGGYKWQKLPGANHTALGDARATANIIEIMKKHMER